MERRDPQVEKLQHRYEVCGCENCYRDYLNYVLQMNEDNELVRELFSVMSYLFHGLRGKSESELFQLPNGEYVVAKDFIVRKAQEEKSWREHRGW